MYFSFKKEDKEKAKKALECLRSFMKSVDFDALMADIEKARGTKIFYRISRTAGQRTLQQNAYYWGAVIPFIHKIKMFPKLAKYDLQDVLNVRGVDMSVQEIYHGLLANQFLGYQVMDKNGKILKGVARTSTLSVEQFENYLMLIQEYVVENFGIPIPSPDEYESWTFYADPEDTQEDFFDNYIQQYAIQNNASSKTENDASGQVEETTSSDEVLGIQGGSEIEKS